MSGFLERFISRVEIEELENDSVEAQALINDLDIKRLPAFYFDHNISIIMYVSRYYAGGSGALAWLVHYVRQCFISLAFTYL